MNYHRPWLKTAKHLRIISSVAALFGSKSNLQAKTIPEIVKETKPAIVEIVTMDEKGRPKELGTGFFISSDGLVVTNFHVIEGASFITAINNNGAVFVFQKVMAQPKGTDLAILKFQAHEVPFLQLGKSTDKVEGEKVIRQRGTSPRPSRAVTAGPTGTSLLLRSLWSARHYLDYPCRAPAVLRYLA